MYDQPGTNPPSTQRSRRPVRRGIGVAATMGIILFAAIALLGATGAVLAVTTFERMSQGLPDPTALEKIELPEQSIVYDRTGKVELARFGDFNREVVGFDQIPPMLVDATTAVEDRTFWQNSGFDPVGIVSAGIDALRGRARGASTITQQLVRQRLLNDQGTAETQVTAGRKVKEIIQSVRVTQAYPGVEGKQRIMAAYLNQNYYGNESYGVAAAAQDYFGKPLKDLTLGQAAILAALPKSPSTYDLVANAVEECVDPAADPETCTDTQLVVPDDSDIVQRRNYVLDQMQQQGGTPLTGEQLTPADFQAAKAEKVVLAPQRSNQWQIPQFVLPGPQGAHDAAVRPRRRDVPASSSAAASRSPRPSTCASRTSPRSGCRRRRSSRTPRTRARRRRPSGVKYDGWIRNLRNKTLRNGALIARTTRPARSSPTRAPPTRRRPTAANASSRASTSCPTAGASPGSAFKPVVYASGSTRRRSPRPRCSWTS